ncbi:Hsp20 family protein [Candidatus Woesearchaeota archaeon]|nr:Hsp20 family protein [Candidatus Woesearchaeota archaeon]
MKDLWDPFEEMKKFREKMDRMMEDFWSKERSLMKNMGVKELSVDIEDKKNQIEINADLPGMDKKDIDVTVEKDRVEIKAKKKKETKEKKKNYYRQERAYSGFYRAFSLPAVVNPDKAKSSFKNGVLKITLPKTKSLPKKSKKLAIK